MQTEAMRKLRRKQEAKANNQKKAFKRIESTVDSEAGNEE